MNSFPKDFHSCSFQAIFLLSLFILFNKTMKPTEAIFLKANDKKPISKTNKVFPS